MNLTSIFGTGPLALEASAVEALRDLLAAQHVAHNARELHEAAARNGATAGRPLDVAVVDGIATIGVDGLLVRHRTWLSDLLGATVLGELEAAIREAAANPDVRGLLLSVDSPGGAVHGTIEVAQAVRDARTRMPVAAFTSGQMQSAAFWIASQADVVACGPVAFVGSIGVVAQHVDVSGAERLVGMKTSEITAGKYKRIASSYAPLSDEGRAVIQDQVDHVYAAFVESVAEGRRAAPLDVLDRMADGRTFIGRQAVEAGLADACCSVGDVLADLRTLIGAKS